MSDGFIVILTVLVFPVFVSFIVKTTCLAVWTGLPVTLTVPAVALGAPNVAYSVELKLNVKFGVPE